MFTPKNRVSVLAFFNSLALHLESEKNILIKIYSLQTVNKQTQKLNIKGTIYIKYTDILQNLVSRLGISVWPSILHKHDRQ